MTITSASHNTLWEVIVQNLGRVYEGSNGFEARKVYNTYVGQSKRGYGRAACEGVVLMRDNEIAREHEGITQ